MPYENDLCHLETDESFLGADLHDHGAVEASFLLHNQSLVQLKTQPRGMLKHLGVVVAHALDSYDITGIAFGQGGQFLRVECPVNPRDRVAVRVARGVSQRTVETCLQILRVAGRAP